MRGERRQVVPAEVLYPRRVAARALEHVLGYVQVHEVALKFNADDPSQAFPGVVEGEVRFFERGWDQGQRALAHVYLERDELGELVRARVMIPVLKAIVRANHRKTFRLDELGIEDRPDRPDVEMEIDLSAIVEEAGQLLRTMPQRKVARPRRGAPGMGGTYRGVLGRRRG